MKRGISFELPNEYGTFLGDVLKPIDITAFSWRIGSGESYKIMNNELSEDLFPEDKKVMEGIALKELLENNSYYIIFADLQAYPKGKIAEINTYEEFTKSDCELVLLVVDSCYATIYCKDKDKLELLYKNARDCRFEDVEYITNENDTRTRLSVW
ncbi:DUF2691 family protein [Bacillus sp. B15-48]|uniref:DUF2691 family protein n=1 Tax=Bacillus sp. B15-48 TaxID=1548601 RepID=UPI00193EE990|nr:DUF2691 family protein [Bacillus sp. B15-48]MBM4765129.1 DUF2691 family protein [Bacillus sp. B15-48]